MTFFQPDINHSEVEDSFQLASDWIKSVGKNMNKSKAVTLGLLAIRLENKVAKESESTRTLFSATISLASPSWDRKVPNLLNTKGYN